jgi:hypothetical protein
VAVEEQALLGRGGAPGDAQALLGADVPLAAGPEWQSDPALNDGAWYQPITSPEDQNWSDLQGRPIHMMEANRYSLGPPYAPSPETFTGTPFSSPDLKYVQDSAVPTNWKDFTDKGTTSGGGFFTIEGLYTGRGEVPPQIFQHNSTWPSTNNWRLLAPGYRDPRYILRNGHIINLKDSEGIFGPYGHHRGLGEESGNAVGGKPWNSGKGVGYPAAHAVSPVSMAISGWPGQMDVWNIHSTT